MCVEERRLLSKIRYLEDMLLRSKDRWKQESISKDLSIMRIRLQKLQQNSVRNGAYQSLFLFFFLWGRTFKRLENDKD